MSPSFLVVFLLICCPVEGIKLKQGCVEIKDLPRFTGHTLALTFRTTAQTTWLIHGYVFQQLDEKQKEKQFTVVPALLSHDQTKAKKVGHSKQGWARRAET